MKKYLFPLLFLLSTIIISTSCKKVDSATSSLNCQIITMRDSNGGFRIGSVPVVNNYTLKYDSNGKVNLVSTNFFTKSIDYYSDKNVYTIKSVNNTYDTVTNLDTVFLNSLGLPISISGYYQDATHPKELQFSYKYSYDILGHVQNIVFTLIALPAPNTFYLTWVNGDVTQITDNKRSDSKFGFSDTPVLYGDINQMDQIIDPGNSGPLEIFYNNSHLLNKAGALPIKYTFDKNNNISEILIADSTRSFGRKITYTYSCK